MTLDDQEPGTGDGGRLRDHEVAEQLTAADAVLIALGRSSSPVPAEGNAADPQTVPPDWKANRR